MMSDSDGHNTCVPSPSPPSSDDELLPQRSGERSSGSKKFSATQTAILTAHYNVGMKGVGKAYTRLICRAAKEANLNEVQVKVTVTR